jgi:ABC-type phosphate transport system auxiliary subunit
METNIASIVKGNLANSQESSKEATSVTEIIQSSKNIIAQQMGYINPAFKLYRDLKDKKVEVQVKIFYEAKQSLVLAKKAIRKELKEKLQKTDEQVDKLLQEPPK